MPRKITKSDRIIMNRAILRNQLVEAQKQIEELQSQLSAVTPAAPATVFKPEEFLVQNTQAAGPPRGVSSTLNERGSRYGDFTDNAIVSQQLKNICEESPGWRRASSIEREGLTMILQKIARICNGDPHYADNWHDIQGYAKLVEDRLP